MRDCDWLRALNPSLVSVRQSYVRECAGKLFNLLGRRFSGLPFLDTQCGFKLYRRDAAHRIFSVQRIDGFSFDVETLFVAQRLGFSIVEVSVRWANAEGTKVSTVAGARSFFDVLTLRRNARRGLYGAGLLSAANGRSRSLAVIEVKT